VSPRLENKLTTSCCEAGEAELLVADLVRDSAMDLTIGGVLFVIFE